MKTGQVRNRLIVPVWGRHRPVFFGNTLPSLLQPGNLPSLAGRAVTRLEIFTRTEERGGIEDELARCDLPDGIEVRIEPLRVELQDSYRAMTECHRAALAHTEEHDRLWFINADLVLCDGALARTAAWAESGVRVVLAAGVRLNRESAAARLKPYLGGGTPGGLLPRVLVELALQTLHPLIERHLFAEGNGPWQIPSMCAWRVGSEGLLLRCFHLHPLLVVPGAGGPELRGTIDDHYVWQLGLGTDQVRVVTDSDELVLFELSDPEHPGGGCLPRGSTLALANWIRRTTRADHRALARHAIELRRGDRGPAWESAAQRSLEQLGSAVQLAAALPFSVPWRAGVALGRLEQVARGLPLRRPTLESPTPT